MIKNIIKFKKIFIFVFICFFIFLLNDDNVKATIEPPPIADFQPTSSLIKYQKSSSPARGITVSTNKVTVSVEYKNLLGIIGIKEAISFNYNTEGTLFKEFNGTDYFFGPQELYYPIDSIGDPYYTRGYNVALHTFRVNTYTKIKLSKATTLIGTTKMTAVLYKLKPGSFDSQKTIFEYRSEAPSGSNDTGGFTLSESGVYFLLFEHKLFHSGAEISRTVAPMRITVIEANEPQVTIAPNGTGTNNWVKNSNVTININDDTRVISTWCKYAWALDGQTPDMYNDYIYCEYSKNPDYSKVKVVIPSPENASGIYKLYFKGGLDVFENIQSTLHITNEFYFDNTSPTQGQMTMKENNSSGIVYENNTLTKSKVYVSINNSYGTDAHSGIAKKEFRLYGATNAAFRTAAYTIENTGITTIELVITDKVGNTISRLYTVKIDRVLPVVIASPATAGSLAAGAGVQYANVKLTASDTGSGINYVTYRWYRGSTALGTTVTKYVTTFTVDEPTNPVPQTAYYLVVSAVDLAGNIKNYNVIPPGGSVDAAFGPYYFADKTGPMIWLGVTPYTSNPQSSFSVEIYPNSGRSLVYVDEKTPGSGFEPTTGITITGPNNFTRNLHKFLFGSICEMIEAGEQFSIPDSSYCYEEEGVNKFFQVVNLSMLGLSAEGEYTITVYAMEKYGSNKYFSREEKTFIYDGTPPYTPSHEMSALNYTTDEVFFEFWCLGDNSGGSGLDSCSLYKNNSLLINGSIYDGVRTSTIINDWSKLKIKAVDKAGNIKWSNEIDVKIIKPSDLTANFNAFYSDSLKNIGPSDWVGGSNTAGFEKLCSSVKLPGNYYDCDIEIRKNYTGQFQKITDNYISLDGIYEVRAKIHTNNLVHGSKISSYSNVKTIKIDKVAKNALIYFGEPNKLQMEIEHLDSRSPLIEFNITINGNEITGYDYPTYSGNFITYKIFEYFGDYSINIYTKDVAGNEWFHHENYRYKNSRTESYINTNSTVNLDYGSGTQVGKLDVFDDTYILLARNNGANNSVINGVNNIYDSLFNLPGGTAASSKVRKYKIGDQQSFTTLSSSSNQISIPMMGSCQFIEELGYQTCMEVKILILSVVDSQGLESNMEILVILIDIRPHVNVGGAGGGVYGIGSTFTPPEVEFTAFIDGDDNQIVSIEHIYEFNGEEVETIDTNVIGSYVIKTYGVDSYGIRSLPYISYIEIVDNVKPEISLIGKETIKLKKGQVYGDEGSLVIDNVDGELVVYSEDEVDYNKPGTYTISYYYIDNAGNKSEVLTRTIIVKSNATKYIVLSLLAAGILAMSVLVILKSKVLIKKK